MFMVVSKREGGKAVHLCDGPLDSQSLTQQSIPRPKSLEYSVRIIFFKSNLNLIVVITKAFNFAAPKFLGN